MTTPPEPTVVEVVEVGDLDEVTVVTVEVARPEPRVIPPAGVGAFVDRLARVEDRVAGLQPGGGEGGPARPDALIAHIAEPAPHPAYDDGPSLVLIFENGIS